MAGTMALLGLILAPGSAPAQEAAPPAPALPQGSAPAAPATPAAPARTPTTGQVTIESDLQQADNRTG